MYRYMWQSRVEIEGYFVTYFDPIAGLEGPIRPLCELVTAMKRVWVLPLIIEIHNWIIFDFIPVLGLLIIVDRKLALLNSFLVVSSK